MSKEFSLDKFDKEKVKKLDSYIKDLNEEKYDEELIHILHHAQGIFGYLPEAIQVHIARSLDIPTSKIYGVASFYSYFNLNPVGKYTISVCMGTACFVRKADKVLDEFKERLGIDTGETTTDKHFTLKDVRCVGACGLAPVVMIGDKVYGSVTPEEVSGIIAEYTEED